MTQFIRQEAQEKAREIQVKVCIFIAFSCFSSSFLIKKADEEHNIEKAKLVRQESISIEANYAKKMKQAENKQKIERSNYTNSNRLKLLQLREDLLSQLFSAARDKLRNSVNAEKYSNLVKNLILQSLNQLSETEVQIVCRKKDTGIVQGLLSSCAKEYEKTSGKNIDISISTTEYISDDSAGGVIVLGNGGRIRCDNSLEARLDIAEEQMLPHVRMLMFGPAPTRRFFD